MRRLWVRVPLRALAAQRSQAARARRVGRALRRPAHPAPIRRPDHRTDGDLESPGLGGLRAALHRAGTRRRLRPQRGRRARTAGSGPPGRPGLGGRHRRRRARAEALGRREAAGRDRADPAQGPAHPAARRGDQRARQRDGAGDPVEPAGDAEGAASSPSPIACRRWSTPTGSSCSTTAGWSRRAPTLPSSRGAGATRGCGPANWPIPTPRSRRRPTWRDPHDRQRRTAPPASVGPEMRPWRWTGSGCGFDRDGRVSVLELDRAAIAQGRVQTSGVIVPPR